MLRCALLSLTACLAFGAPPPAFAQTLVAQAASPRSFPATALRGDLRITQPPQAVLNGQAVRLAPGARIRGVDNMMQLSGSLVNQRLLVHYTVDISGQLRDVWVLTPAEAARPWPVTPQQAQAWRFDPGTQTWSRP
jgi:hypothetical protein